MACIGFQRGCTCGPCNARYMMTYANSHTYGPVPHGRLPAMTAFLGDVYRKQPNGRVAQISAFHETQDGNYAVLYWPDRNTQTTVRVDRLTPRGHWHKTNGCG